jgi:DNA-binding NtrC family response regulator
MANLEGVHRFADLVLRAEAMQRVVALGRRAAASTIPVLIEGESGVGKELIARAIQGEGERASKPFVIVNCGAIPDKLVESILFGHEKGSFTGAFDKRIGKFQ